MVKMNHKNHNIPNISAVFRILRLTFVGKSASKSCIQESSCKLRTLMGCHIGDISVGSALYALS